MLTSLDETIFHCSSLGSRRIFFKLTLTLYRMGRPKPSQNAESIEDWPKEKDWTTVCEYNDPEETNEVAAKDCLKITNHTQTRGSSYSPYFLAL